MMEIRDRARGKGGRGREEGSERGRDGKKNKYRRERKMRT